jgi:outer membrane protein OmpA-like peptidoglycan-associated protein
LATPVPRDSGSPLDGWAALACLLAALLLVFVLIAAMRPAPNPDVAAPPPAEVDPDLPTAVTPVELSELERRLRGVGAEVRTQSRVVSEWDSMLAALCTDPRLLALGVRPDCATGTIALTNGVLFEADETGLRESGREILRGALSIVLDTLRDHPAAWRSLSAIEVRGHADPLGSGDPYVANLVVSQQRALAVHLFLTTDEGMAEPDRADLQRLVLSSGASHSRPPADCTPDTRSCYERWRRVEIHLARDDAALQSGFEHFLTRLRDQLP